MRFRLFPVDLEGTGCYRLIYPYGMIDRNTVHECTLDFSGESLVDSRGDTKLNIPSDMVTGLVSDYGREFLSADTFVFQRPMEVITPLVIAWLRSHGKQVVVDLDDWYEGIPAESMAFRELEKSNRHRLDAIRRALSHASLITTSTPRLAKLYGNHAPTAVLPNRLLGSDWAQVAPVYERDVDRVRVGWMGVLKVRGRDLDCLRQIGKWLRARPQVDFVAVGDRDVLDHLQVPAGQRRFYRFRRFPGHIPATGMIDIGLVPLQLSTFNECKSSLKGMEHGACGAPVVASPTGPYRQWLDAGNGLLASSPREWVEALDALLENDLWRTMGEANHAKAMGNTIEEHWPRWLEVLEQQAVAA